MSAEFDDDEFLVDDDECPCCRMMEEEFGMTEEVPLEMLARRGVDFPDPITLDEATLHSTLWRVLIAMAEERIFFSYTDHLSDRAVYELLWTDILRKPMLHSADTAFSCHVDLLGGGSEEDNQLWLRFYADDETRRRWAREFPAMEIPSHEELPFHRDGMLPAPEDVAEAVQ